tara:strand:- start:38 stop:2749 length:2712 start_codon:yes stop_codon:yes gene_type:complete
MEFKLEISRDNLANSYYDVDLFPQQELEYDLDFYDSLEIDKVRLPFYTTLKIPLTTNNKTSSRFDFDPLNSPSLNFPKQDFYFKVTVFGSTTTEIGGILNVISFEYNSSQSYIEVELKDYLSKYLADIKDVKLGDLYTDNYHTTRSSLNIFRGNTASGGEAGIKQTNPDYTRPISFPYVDFCNDVDGKFGYGARQFLEYGTGIDRTGIMPVFSVKGFLQYLTAYISSASFPLRVDSKLFELGNYSLSPAFPEFQAEKLQMVIPSQLLAKEDINRRNFFVRQSPAWSGTNQSLQTCESEDGNLKLIHTEWFGSMETAGNYGTDGEGNPLYATAEWGAEKRMGFYPADLDAQGEYHFDGIRGFFCPKVSFNADIRLNSGSALVVISQPKLEIPIVGEDKMVDNIYPLTSNMRFKVYIAIYEDGFMSKKIPLQDAQGDDIILTMSDVTAVQQGNSNKNSTSSPYDYYSCEEGHTDDGAILSNNGPFEDTLLFNDFEAYFPQDQEIFVNGGSRYGVNYFIEPLDGELDIRYASQFNIVTGTHHIATAFAQALFEVNDLRKLVTRIENYGELNIKFNSNADTLLYKLTDEFIISESINKTCPLNVSEIFAALLKRFDCGLFYEYDDSSPDPALHTHVLRIDPLAIVRTGSQNINNLIDDLKSFKISNGGDKVKTLEINNKSFDLYFDDVNNDNITIGSTTQQINTEGIAEIKFDLDSSIYYRSVCGPFAFDVSGNQNFQNGAFSEKELGFTANIFTKNKDIGLRFAYLDKPVVDTNLKIPLIKLKGNDQGGQMITETERIYIDLGRHTFNGRLFPYNTAGWSLMFEDENGNTTDTYDNIFAVSEKIIQSENPRIEFDMVVPTSNLASLDFFLQTLSASRITPSAILVKKASGQVYNDFAYITIEGILQ